MICLTACAHFFPNSRIGVARPGSETSSSEIVAGYVFLAWSLDKDLGDME